MPRSTNDLITPIQAMTALGTVATPNTDFTLRSGVVLINSDEQLLQRIATPPALVLENAGVSKTRNGIRRWQANLKVVMTYIDAWEQSSETLDQRWSELDTDINLMLANLEDNPRLVVAATAGALEITRIDLSPYSEKLHDDGELYGIPVVQRYAIITLNLPTYSSAG